MAPPFFKDYIIRTKKRYKNVPKDISFPLFIRYTLEELRSGTADEHWAPTTQMLPVCLLKFDVIGKFETLEEDATLVLPHLFNRNFSLPVMNKTPNQRDYISYFEKLDNKSLRELQKHYADDFEAYGYDPNDINAK